MAPDRDRGRRGGRSLLPVLASWLGSQADARPWLPPAAAVTGSIVAAVLFSSPSTATVVVGACALLIGGLPEVAASWWRKEEERVDANTATQYRLATKNAIGPIADLLSELMNEPQDRREAVVRQVAQQVVGSAVMQFSQDREVRSIVYAVSDDQQRMTSIAHTGRDQQPQDFVRGTHRGNLAFKTLESGKPLFVTNLDDLKEEKPKKWSGSGDGYKAFITVPIGYGERGYGLLTVDAPVAGTFDETDAYFIEVLAKMMGLAYAAQATTPRMSEPGTSLEHREET